MELWCSFCGKSEHEVLLLIAGPQNNFICDDCVEACVKLINEISNKKLNEDEFFPT